MAFGWDGLVRGRKEGGREGKQKGELSSKLNPRTELTKLVDSREPSKEKSQREEKKRVGEAVVAQKKKQRRKVQLRVLSSTEGTKLGRTGRRNVQSVDGQDSNHNPVVPREVASVVGYTLSDVRANENKGKEVRIQALARETWKAVR